MQLILAPSGGDNSLQAELQFSLHSSKKTSKADSSKHSEVSDSNTELPSMGSSAYRKAVRTFQAIQGGRLGDLQGGRLGVEGQGSSDTSRAVGGSVFQSYTISRENSFSPDEEELEAVQGRWKEEATTAAPAGALGSPSRPPWRPSHPKRS